MEMMVLAVVGLMFLLSAAATLSSIWAERRQPKREPRLTLRPSVPLTAAREFSTVSLSDAFDPDTACIWEPQIEMLERIERAEEPGVHVDELRAIYRQFAEKYPELYEGSDLESWLEAMEQADLIAWAGANVRLTPAGTAFLKCRLPVPA